MLIAVAISLLPFAATQAQRPNIMIILADDLGFSDLGCYGGEIETPNLDQLASDGVRFARFYNTGRCWPTRASLLTGFYPQQVRRDKLPGVNPSGMPGKRPKWAPLVPVYLKEAGYRSYHTGKWHLDSKPIKAGFDDSYFLGDQARFFSPRTRFENDKPLPAIERNSNYYATVDLADQAIRVLTDHSANYSDTPFFHYLALTAPHFPLHALPEDIDKYRERYREGWDKLRAERWKRILELELIDRRWSKLSEVEFETGAPYARPQDVEAFGAGEAPFPVAWNSLTDKQKDFQATKMAIHAAMVDRIDQELGRVFQHLRDTNQFDNTLIIFLSDNGASSELMIRDDGHNPKASPGSADTHLCLGPGWSTVCNTPFRKHKSWVHEGGIATPMIAHWPKGIRSPGKIDNTPGHVIDFVPTMLELAEIQQETVNLINNQVPLPGISLAPLFHDGPLGRIREYLWWSHENHQAIQVGDAKLVKTAQSDWEFYDLRNDRCETEDQAETRRGPAGELKELWLRAQAEFVLDANRESKDQE